MEGEPPASPSILYLSNAGSGLPPTETEPCYEFGAAGNRDRVQTYEIHCGGRVVSSVRSYTARHAVTDYLRSLGCPDDEMESVSSDQVSWRGAVYSGVATTEPSSSTSSQPER
jgi:hypothetical protein